MISVAHEEHAVTVTPRNRANFRRLKTNSIQSYKRWEKENELLYAMMEDESEWLAKLFPDVVISPDFFFYALEDGSLLCRLANYIQEKAEAYSRERKIAVPGKKFRYHTMGKCNKEIKLFKSRENVQQFLTWCRSHGIPEAILFESNDVVQVDDYREGCRGVIICLMEIVRRTAKFELDELPQLIQMEKEIEEDEAKHDTDLSDEHGQILEVEQINRSEFENLEVQQTDQPEIQSPSSLDSDSGVDSVFDQEEGDNTASRLTEFSVEESEERTKTTAVTRKQTPSKPEDRKSCPKSQKKTDELPSLLDSKGPKSELDKQVCKLAQDYNIKVVHRLKEGKYIILGRIMFVRMLNDHMLVRIGGGWDTLEHYLMTHVPSKPSKQALESSSATPSSQAPTSPRNSISTGTGGRNSLFDKVKRREQIGVINRDSPVYSSQGSLSHPLASQSTPNLREKSKKLSIVESDKKDITDAIRKIESSVSQNLASRPVSFTSKTFHQLKSRFDKVIFGSSRRTSSPDLSLKGRKILRRLSDTSTMADIATTLSFDRMDEDQQQIASGNNNDAGLKQTESGGESFSGKTTAPSEDLFGNETRQSNELISVDETDGSESRGDLPSTDHAKDSHWTDNLLGGPLNGSEKFHPGDQGETAVDVSSFDPFTPTGDQDQLISTENEPSEVTEEKPNDADDVEEGAVVGNGHLELESIPGIVHETAEMHDELIVTEALELTPRIDLGDLLADSQPVDQVTPELQEPTEESSPSFELGDPLVDTKSVEAEKEDFMERSPTDHQISEVEATNPFEKVTSDEQFDGKDVQDIPAIGIDPVVESPHQEEATKLEEPVPSEESAVKSEGESTTPVSDEVTSEEQSQEVAEVSYIKGDESMEETSTSENKVRILEEAAKPAELQAKPVMEEAKSVRAEMDSVEAEAKVALEDVQSVKEKSTPANEDVMPVEEESKFTEEGVKPPETDAMPSEVQMQIAEEEGQTSEEEVKPVQKEAKPAEVYAFMLTDEGVPPVGEEAKSTEEEMKSLEEVKPLEVEARLAEVEIKNTEVEGKAAAEDVRSVEEEVKPVEKEAKPVDIYALKLTNEEVTPVKEEAKSTEEEVNSLDKEVKPATVETRPREPETKPSEEETKPPLEETKPSEEETQPPLEKTKPSEEETQPPLEETKPSEEETKPPSEETKPSEEETKPPLEETKPSEEETKPPLEETKPSEEETQTPLEETKPSEKEVKPVEKTAKPAETHAFPTDKKTDKITKTKSQSVGAKSAKSPSKAAPSTGLAAAKKQPGATKPSSGTSRKDVKAPVTKAPASKPSAATKAPATKSTTTTTPSTKKPIGKAAATKTDEIKKPERPKSAATARPPTKSSVTGTTRPASASPHKVPASTTKPPARKAPGVDSTDSGTPKSAPKTTAGRPASTKLTQVKTSSPATKPTATKPSRPQSAKPSDKTDGATKTPNLRPQSAKPKSTTTTTTTVKKTTTTTKTGTAPLKTSTTKTVTGVKNGPVKSSTTTTRPTKPSLTTKTAAKPTTANLKSKPGVKTSTAGAKPSTKSPPKKKVDEAKEKQKQIKLDESVSKEEKIVELEDTEKEKPPEIVEVVSEERPIEGSSEGKLIELTPVSAYEQASPSAEVSSEGVVTQIVTSQTTTVVADGEEQTATTTNEEFTFEQFEGES